MAQYNEHFTTPESQNWLKGWVAVKTAAEALAPFACKVCDDIRVKKLKKSIKHLVPDLCENCSIVEIIPCDPNNNICNAGQCRFHNGRIFRPCLIVKCNEYRNTVTDDIQKGIDIRFTCNSCRTTEIVKCNPRNKVCNSGRCKFHMDQNTKQFIPTRPCRNNICDTLRDAIEQKHRFGNPSWKNTDARKWCVNAWDIAKCFMPPDGYANVDNEEDTDLNGIISVYINCEEFQQYFTADLSLPRNLCTKVRDVGKHVRHAPKPEVTDDNLKVWFTDLKALLSDPTFHKANPRAQDAIDQLDKLESDDYVIPPSDIKAALESFKSELKNYLIRYHSRNNSSLPLGPCLDLEDSGLWDLYVRPNISRVDLQSIHRDKKSMERTTEPLTNLEQLFSSKGIIFLTADAGVGKTSFCKFLVLSWCKVQEGTTDLKSKVSGTQTRLSDIEYLKEFTYLFYINLRENQHDTLEYIIFSHTEYVYTKLTKDNQAFNDMLSNENGLFILDGLDECSIPSIKPLAENRKYTVLITSRPWKLANIHMPSKYTHAKIQVLQQDESKQLVFRANNCLNKHFKTSYEIGDFLDAIKTRFVESQLENPMFALQLLCVYHEKRSKNTTDPGNTRQRVSTYLGKTKSHIYANMIELMFRSVEKKDEPLVQDLIDLYENSGQTHNLPECFGERNYTCSSLAKLINAIGKLAAYSLLDDHKSFIEERQIRELNKKEKLVLLKSGLLSETSLNTLSEKRNVYTFLHQTYREMLACVFLSSQDFESDIWRKFIIEFNSVTSPEMLSFLCVMNYNQGCKCLDKFNEKKLLFQRGGFSLLFELIDYQTTMTMAYKECSDNGIKKPQIRLKHALLDPDIGIRTDHALLQESGLELETLFISDYSVTTVIEPNLFTNSLAHLQVHDATFHADHIVLSDCTQLLTIELWNTHISHLTINPSRLEMFSVTTKSKLIQEMPPMRVSFVSGSQFSSNLKELSLVHVVVDVPLDLANCKQLQRLVMTNTSSGTMKNKSVVYNMQRCDALQELRLGTLTFPADTHLDLSECTCLTDISLARLKTDITVQFPQNVHEISIDGVTVRKNTHLDLSGLTHLSKITIQNTRLSHVTINPSCLEKFWVYVKPELIQEIPPVKLSFVGGSQFSSNLKELSLVHVTMDVPLDLANCPKLQQLVMENTSSDSVTGKCVVRIMQRCDALQKLRLDTLTFPADTHLDLSELTCLTDISLVTLMTDITVQFPQNVHEIFIDGVTFRKNTHLDLSGLTHISKITIQNTRLSHVTINPSCLEKFWVYVKPELRQEIPPVKLSFVSESQFSSNLKELSLVHVTMDAPLDLANCQQLQKLVMENTSSDSVTGICVVRSMQRCNALQELRLETLTFPADTHLDLSELTCLTDISLVTLMTDITVQFPQNVHEIFIDGVTFRKNTHLDLSGLAHLSKIAIQNTRLSHVTINPSCLETFWVNVKPELIQEIPPVKLSFVSESQFSSNLKELSLVHVTMDVPLDLANCQQLHKLVMENTSSDSVTGICVVRSMQRCDALQELRLDTLTFPADTHLDLSGLTHLSSITIQNTRLSRVTINPSCLEKFWVYVKPELIQEIPPVKLSFVGGSQFSSNLKELSLVHVNMDVPLDLANCQKLHKLVMGNTSSDSVTGICVVRSMQRCDALQELRLDTLTFPADTHLDLSGLTHLSKITIQNTRLSHVTINPSCLEEFCV
ncbi:uncharacterized protein LOC128209061 [Mya arenaria]|uniref:uncharacterized protein LOC128209061 n=1 Tax=Mya arenaria TaxID=6604 RepID=UPI0022E8979A|nr:uncharacterized protein LOC128209061 [Mya arenaria]